MNKIFTFIATAILFLFSLSAYAVTSEYCEQTVQHQNLENQTASAIKLTIAKIDATSMYVEIESADADAVDLLLINEANEFSKSESDTSTPGKISRILTATGDVPSSVSLEILWSKESADGNWMLNTFSVPFDAECAPAVEDNEVPTNFTASLGTIASTSVEFKLKATDNSGSVVYYITYGTTTVNTTGTSDVEKTYTLTGLTEATSYDFSISAKDGSQNEASNNPITLSATTISTPKPTVAAAAPTKEAEDVIAVYSDTYVSNASNINPNWGQSTVVTEEDVDGNKFLKYATLNYQGTDYPTTDVSAMEYVHLDYWTTSATAFELYLITSNGENAYNIVTELGLTKGQWVGIDIPLSYFSTAGRDLATAFQFKITGDETIYFDNFYFWKAPTVAESDDASLSDLKIDNVTVENFSSISYSYSIKVANGTTTAPTVTASTTIADATYVVNAAASIPGTTTVEVTAKNGTDKQTYSINFEESAYIGAAPTPTKEAIDVVSVYSDDYTSIATNLFPNWGQATATTEEEIEGNKTLKYANLNYQGLEYTTSDVSTMEYLHLDYWTEDATALEIFLIADGENSYNIATELTITTNQWVSVDIPLSYYSDAGRDLAAAAQFKTVGNGTIYFDNFYFWKAPTAQTADVTLSSLTVDGDTIDDFAAAKGSYEMFFAYGTTDIPVVAATASNTNATVIVTQITAFPGTATVKVISEDGNANTTYSVYFEASVPATAATTPAHEATDVISVFSDDYTNIATNLNPNWSQSTEMSIVEIESNETMRYGNLNYQGTEYTETDISGMAYLHLDYWTLDATALEIVLIAGSEVSYNIGTELGIVTAGWQSIDIPLSYFSNAGATLSTAIQFKVVGDGTVYFDNFLFWKEPSSLNEHKILETLNIYPNPANDWIQVNAKNVTAIEVYDLVGRSVLKTTAVSNSINISNLSNGTYIIAADVDGSIQTVKFIKQ